MRATLVRESTNSGSWLNALLGMRMATGETAITVVVAHGGISVLVERCRDGLLMDLDRGEAEDTGADVTPVQDAEQVVQAWMQNYCTQRSSLATRGLEQKGASIAWFNACAFQGTDAAPLLYSKQL